MTGKPCDRCCRKIWDPVRNGFMLYCTGHYDNHNGIFVALERKAAYTVRECRLFKEDTSQICESPLSPDVLHNQHRGAGRQQTFIEGFV